MSFPNCCCPQSNTSCSGVSLLMARITSFPQDRHSMLRARNIHEHWGLNIRLESEISLLFQSHKTAIRRKVLKFLSDLATRYNGMGKAVIAEIRRQWNGSRFIISADHLKQLWYDFGDTIFPDGNFDDDGDDLYIDIDPTLAMSILEQGVQGLDDALDEKGEEWDEENSAGEAQPEEDGNALQNARSIRCTLLPGQGMTNSRGSLPPYPLPSTSHRDFHPDQFSGPQSSLINHSDGNFISRHPAQTNYRHERLLMSRTEIQKSSLFTEDRFRSSSNGLRPQQRQDRVGDLVPQARSMHGNNAFRPVETTTLHSCENLISTRHDNIHSIDQAPTSIPSSATPSTRQSLKEKPHASHQVLQFSSLRSLRIYVPPASSMIDPDTTVKRAHQLPITRTTGQAANSLPDDAAMSISQRLQWLKEREKARANRAARQSDAIDGQGSYGPHSGATASRTMSHPMQTAPPESPYYAPFLNATTFYSTSSGPSHDATEYNEWAPHFPTGTLHPDSRPTFRPDYSPSKHNENLRTSTHLSPALRQQPKNRTNQRPSKVIDSAPSTSRSHPDKRSRSPRRNRSQQGHPQRRLTSSSTDGVTAVRSSVRKVESAKVDKRSEVGDGVRRAVEQIRMGWEEEK